MSNTTKTLERLLHQSQAIDDLGKSIQDLKDNIDWTVQNPNPFDKENIRDYERLIAKYSISLEQLKSEFLQSSREFALSIGLKLAE